MNAVQTAGSSSGGSVRLNGNVEMLDERQIVFNVIYYVVY